MPLKPSSKLALDFSDMTFLTRKWLALRYVTPIKRIREQRVSAHSLIYSFLFSKLSLGFGLDFEFGLGLTLGLDLALEFGLGLGLGLGLE